MLIDFHTHAFPEKIAARAVLKLAQDAGGLENQTDGLTGQMRMGNTVFSFVLELICQIEDGQDLLGGKVRELEQVLHQKATSFVIIKLLNPAKHPGVAEILWQE